MKLALLIGLDADKRSGRPLTAGLVPFDQALTAFKGMVSARKGPAAHVQLWTHSGIAKTAKFEDFAPLLESSSIKPVEIPEELKKLKKDDLIELLAGSIQRIAELESKLAELNQPSQQVLQEPVVEGEELELSEDTSPLIPAK